MRFHVWSSSETNWASRTKLFVFDDRGTLDVADGGFVFHGRKQHLVVERITDVHLDRQVFPIVSWVATIAVVVAVLVAYALLLIPALDAPWQVAFAASLLVLLVLGTGVAILLNEKQDWVVVTGLAADGTQVTGRFHDASRLGWAGILDGNRRLAEALGMA